MPIIKSAKKRVRVAGKAAARNSKTKRNLKAAVKALHGAIKSGGKKTDKQLKKAHSTIDTAVKKNVIHKNKAARKKSQAAKAAKSAAGVTKKSVAKKPTAKKAAPSAGKRRTVAKKPVAKKKPVTKKTPAKKK